jgi:hypothetical protein
VHLVCLVLSFEVPGTESGYACVDYCAGGFEWDVDGQSNVAYEVGFTLDYQDVSCQLSLGRKDGVQSTLVLKTGLLGTALSGRVV